MQRNQCGETLNDGSVAASLRSIAAVVVLYYPDTEALERSIASIEQQVGCILLIDNTPGAVARATADGAARIEHHALGDNLGIAAAQNVGIRRAIELGCTHVLLLDQDSEPPPGMVAALYAVERSLVGSGIKLAAVGPMTVDVNRRATGPVQRYRYFRVHLEQMPEGSPPSETDWLIASGALTRCSVFNEAGLMREELFIDSVDADWGMRARSLGFQSYLVPSVVMPHSIGSLGLFRGKKVSRHSSVRSYYMARNLVYLLRFRYMGWRFRSNVWKMILLYLVMDVSMTDRKRALARVFAQAVLDGVRGRMGPCRRPIAS